MSEARQTQSLLCSNSLSGRLGPILISAAYNDAVTNSVIFGTPNSFCVVQGNVEYVAVRAGKDECATPAKLVQNYVVCQLDKKLDVLLGFIKTHLKSKIIVFFTSCSQVRVCARCCVGVAELPTKVLLPGSDVPPAAVRQWFGRMAHMLVFCTRISWYAIRSRC